MIHVLRIPRQGRLTSEYGQVRALKEQPGQDIVGTGSITLCHALIPARA